MKIYPTPLGPIMVESRPRKRVSAFFPRALRMLLLNAGLEKVQLEPQEDRPFRFCQDVSEEELNRVEKLLNGYSQQNLSKSIVPSYDRHRILREAKIRRLSAA